MSNLEGKTAIVTGAARRLGRHIALSLAERGMHVIIHYATSIREAEETASLVRERGAKAWLIQADFSSIDEPGAFAKKCGEVSPGITVLVNSASIFRHGNILEAPVAEFVDNFRINVLAPLELCRWFAGQVSCGSIVNLLDARMDDYVKDHIPYALSKQTLNSITRILSLELAPEIRVNAVAPGVVLPPPGRDEEYLEKWAATNPLKTSGSPQDISEAVLYLVDAGFVTGQVIYVDGGRHIREMTHDP